MSNEIISVVGGGWSFAEVDQKKLPGLIICANEAGVLLPRADAIVTMDRLWTENRFSALEQFRRSFYVRRGALQNIDKARCIGSWLKPFECSNLAIEEDGVAGFSEDASILNGDNSGVNALNLAYILRPKQLLMFGFDMCRHPNGNPYWYPPYSWVAQTGGTKPAKYDKWAREFNNIAIAFASIRCVVLNVSAHTKINAFRKVTPKQIGVEK